MREARSRGPQNRGDISSREFAGIDNVCPPLTDMAVHVNFDMPTSNSRLREKPCDVPDANSGASNMRQALVDIAR